ncbi:MAG: hypothetical protein ACYTBX_11670 [Planctomycetota bacterium]
MSKANEVDVKKCFNKQSIIAKPVAFYRCHKLWSTAAAKADN